VKRIRPFNCSIRELQLDIGDNRLTLPKRAQILTVAYDQDEILHLTVICDPDFLKDEERRFIVLTPGARVPHNAGALSYLGSPRRHGRAAFHVFEIDSPEDGPRLGTKRGAASVIAQQNAPVSGVNMQVGQMLGHAGGLATPGVYVQ